MKVRVGKTNFMIDDDSISSSMTHTSTYDENHHCTGTLTVGPFINQKVKTIYQYDDKNRLKLSATFYIFDDKRMRPMAAAPSVLTNLYYDDQDRIVRMTYTDNKLDVNDVHEIRYTYTPTDFGTIILTRQYAGDGHIISTVGFNEDLQKEIYRFDKDGVMIIKYFKEGDDIIEKRYSKTDKSSMITISKYEFDRNSKKHYLVYSIDSSFNFKLEYFDSITVEEIKKQGYEREVKYSYSDDYRILSKYQKHNDIDGRTIETNDVYNYDESSLVSITSNMTFEDGKSYSKTTKYFAFEPTSSDSSIFEDHHKYYICKDNNSIIYIQDSPFTDYPYNGTIFENENKKQYVIGYVDATNQSRFSIVSQNKDRTIKYEYSDCDSSISYKTPTHYYDISVQRVLDQSGKAIMLSNINICNYKNGDKISDDRFITVNDPIPTFSMIDHLLKVAKIDIKAKQIQTIITRLSRDWR